MAVNGDNECVDASDAPELGSKSVFVQWLDTSKWGSGLYVMCAADCPSTTVQVLCADSSAPNGVLVRATCLSFIVSAPPPPPPLSSPLLAE